MKKFWPLIGAILVVLAVFVLTKTNFQAEKILGFNGEETPSTIDLLEIDYKGRTYSFWWQEVPDTAKLILIPNFEEKLNLKEAAQENNCTVIVNAGFYSLTNLPLGLFISEGKTLKTYNQNNLLNGVYSVNYMGIPRITRTPPQDSLRIVLQSGPVLIENDQAQELKLVNDKSARRTVAATTGENKTVFILVFDDTSDFAGPYLEDMPSILTLFEQKVGINIADALNLDGGTASGAWDGDFYLSSASPIGSFFCATEN